MQVLYLDSHLQVGKAANSAAFLHEAAAQLPVRRQQIEVVNRATGVAISYEHLHQLLMPALKHLGEVSL